MGDVRHGTGLYWLVEWSGVSVQVLMLCLLADGVCLCLFVFTTVVDGGSIGVCSHRVLLCIRVCRCVLCVNVFPFIPDCA